MAHLAKLIQAISESFPGAQLEIFLDDRFNIKLEAVAGGTGDTEIIYNLLKHLDALGTRSKVLDAMVEERPQNKKLENIVKIALQEAQSERPALWEIERDIENEQIEQKKPCRWFRVVAAVLVTYAACLTLLATIPLSTNLSIDAENNLSFPPVGHSIWYNEYSYGVNVSGDTRINVHPINYLWAFANGGLEVQVGFPTGGGRSKPRALKFSGIFTLSPILLSANAGGPGGNQSEANPQREGRRQGQIRPSPWNLTFPAHAATESGGRLYLQGASLPGDANIDFVDASMVVGKTSKNLLVLGSDLDSRTEAQLPVKAASVGARKYQFFFELPRPSAPSGAVIKLQGSTGFFSARYSETFELPKEVPLGTELKVTGDRGGTIVVQLAYPYDVVFFERTRTSPVTEALIPIVAAAGFAPRINTNGARYQGDYNAIYSGTGVPDEALRKVLKIALDKGVDLRLVQANLDLRNGVQTQIQVGSNARISCLPLIRSSPQTVAKLTNPSSDADFKGGLKQVQDSNCP